MHRGLLIGVAALAGLVLLAAPVGAKDAPAARQLLEKIVSKSPAYCTEASMPGTAELAGPLPRWSWAAREDGAITATLHLAAADAARAGSHVEILGTEEAAEAVLKEMDSFDWLVGPAGTDGIERCRWRLEMRIPADLLAGADAPLSGGAADGKKRVVASLRWAARDGAQAQTLARLVGPGQVLLEQETSRHAWMRAAGGGAARPRRRNVELMWVPLMWQLFSPRCRTASDLEHNATGVDIICTDLSGPSSLAVRADSNRQRVGAVSVNGWFVGDVAHNEWLQVGTEETTDELISLNYPLPLLQRPLGASLSDLKPVGALPTNESFSSYMVFNVPDLASAPELLPMMAPASGHSGATIDYAVQPSTGQSVPVPPDGGLGVYGGWASALNDPSKTHDSPLVGKALFWVDLWMMWDSSSSSSADLQLVRVAIAPTSLPQSLLDRVKEGAAMWPMAVISIVMLLCLVLIMGFIMQGLCRQESERDEEFYSPPHWCTRFFGDSCGQRCAQCMLNFSRRRRKGLCCWFPLYVLSFGFIRDCFQRVGLGGPPYKLTPQVIDEFDETALSDDESENGAYSPSGVRPQTDPLVSAAQATANRGAAAPAAGAGGDASRFIDVEAQPEDQQHQPARSDQ